MKEQLNKAVELLEAIQLDLINNDIHINALLIEQLNEFIETYYESIDDNDAETIGS